MFHKKFKGFSLVEGMVAIFIVGITMVGFMAVMGKVFKTTTYERDYIVAANLAQEGIEVVRNIRDNNLKKSGCSAFGGGSCSFPSGNYTPGGIYNNTNIPSEISNASDTARTINISNGPTDDSRTVTSTVATSRGVNVEVSDTLWAWGDAE